MSEVLRIAEITSAILLGALGAYLGFKGAANVMGFYVQYQQLDAHEKVRKVKDQAICFSLSSAAFLAALVLVLMDVTVLLLAPFVAGLFWLSYVTYRLVTLAADRRR